MDSRKQLTDVQIIELSNNFDFDGTETDHGFIDKPLDEYWDYQGKQIVGFARAVLEAQRRLTDGNA